MSYLGWNYGPAAVGGDDQALPFPRNGGTTTYPHGFNLRLAESRQDRGA